MTETKTQTSPMSIPLPAGVNPLPSGGSGLGGEFTEHCGRLAFAAAVLFSTAEPDRRRPRLNSWSGRPCSPRGRARFAHKPICGRSSAYHRGHAAQSATGAHGHVLWRQPSRANRIPLRAGKRCRSLQRPKRSALLPSRLPRQYCDSGQRAARWAPHAIVRPPEPDRTSLRLNS
jgi:hypothetical protein